MLKNFNNFINEVYISTQTENEEGDTIYYFDFDFIQNNIKYHYVYSMKFETYYRDFNSLINISVTQETINGKENKERKLYLDSTGKNKESIVTYDNNYDVVNGPNNPIILIRTVEDIIDDYIYFFFNDIQTDKILMISRYFINSYIKSLFNINITDKENKDKYKKFIKLYKLILQKIAKKHNLNFLEYLDRKDNKIYERYFIYKKELSINDVLDIFNSIMK